MCCKRLQCKDSPSRRILILSKTLHSMRRVMKAQRRGSGDQHLAIFTVLCLRGFTYIFTGEPSYVQGWSITIGAFCLSKRGERAKDFRRGCQCEDHFDLCALQCVLAAARFSDRPDTLINSRMTQGCRIRWWRMNQRTMTKTHAKTKTKTKTNTKWLKDPTCAIFSKMIWLKDVEYDDGGWTEGDDNDKDTRKDKDKDNDKDEMTKRPNMCHIFENDMTQGYQIRWWRMNWRWWQLQRHTQRQRQIQWQIRND